MKLCVVLLTGAADHPLEELGDRTPLAAAALPALDQLAGSGRVGGVRTVPERVRASVEAGFASLLGVDLVGKESPAGGLLAMALGEKLGPRDRAFRCDLVNLYDGAVVDPTAGRLGEAESGLLVTALQEALGTEVIRFRPGFGFRALVVVGEGQADGCRTKSPVSFLGEPVSSHTAGGPGSELVRGLTGRAEGVLGEHEINAVRIDLSENPANGIWIWGGGPLPEATGNGVGAAIGRHPSFLGLARLAGYDVSRPESEDPGALRDAALADLAENDVVLVEADAALDISRLGDVEGKLGALETLDRELIGPLAESLVATDEGRILVVPTHMASVSRRRDAGGMMPFVVAGPDVVRYGDIPFSEEGAQQADLKVESGLHLFDYARGTR